MNKYDYKIITPFKWFIIENFPFIEEDLDAITNWQLFQKLGNEINKIIASQNNVGEQVETLTNAFISLQDYINNYFENLDVQEEIDNKLDEMVESGELQAIIETFLQSNALMCFDTIAELKVATSLINGSYARTLGYYAVNDGGSAIYKIVDSITGSADDMTQIAIANDLYAILIYDNSNINVKQMGVHGDGETNDATLISNVLDIAQAGSEIYFPSGNYIINSPINITKTITLKGTSISVNAGTKFTFNNTNGLVLKAPYIVVKNIELNGTNKDSSAIDLANNIYGVMGVVNQYTDDYTNGGCLIEKCNIHGFNIGIATFSTRVTESKWSGAYRVVRNCIVNYNDIGYLFRDGATFNTIEGGNISNNTKHGIYAETQTYYQNIEVIDVAMEQDGTRGAFTDSLFTDFGIYVGNETKIKFTNSYLEDIYANVNDGGIIELLSTHVHSNVLMFGFGQILSESSHAPYKTKMPFSLDFSTRATGSNLTIASVGLYGSAPYSKLTATTNASTRLNFPNLTYFPYTMKNIDCLQLDFDFQVDAGYNVENLAIHPILEIVGFTSNNKDSTSVANTYSPKNLKITDNKWHHFTMFWKPRIRIERKSIYI